MLSKTIEVTKTRVFLNESDVRVILILAVLETWKFWKHVAQADVIPAQKS